MGEHDDGLSFWEHCIAGSCAGIAEHATVFPFDTVKTLLQSPTTGRQYTGMFSALRTVIREEGLLRLYRGLVPAAVSSVPAHAAYFATYEWVRAAAGARGMGDEVAAMAGGACACAAHDTCSVPFDVVKQRLQEGLGQRGRTATEVAAGMLRAEGGGAFFRSLPTTIAMNAPHQAVHWVVYEAAKKATGHDIEEQVAWDFFACGAIAGATAAAVSQPLDVVRTRLQLGAVGARATARALIAGGGVAALWTGLAPRIAFCAPSAAVSMLAYETAKGLLRDRHAAADAAAAVSAE